MKTYFLILAMTLSSLVRAQFFYDDIIGAELLEDRMQVLLEQKVAAVTATGYDERGAASRDFNELQQVDPKTRTWYRQTRNGLNITRQAFRFNEAGRLISVSDTTAGISSISDYRYDNRDRLTEILTTVKDSAREFNNSESHQWFYDDQDQPVKLWKIVNDTDTTEYRFTVDEKGQVTEEQLYRRGVGLDILYYYYNNSGDLTDIVRYNKRVKKLLPDFMFEYDTEGRVIQKISLLSTATSNYVIWRYAYNEKGLKTKEALFNKQKELTGRIDYLYRFFP